MFSSTLLANKHEIGFHYTSDGKEHQMDRKYKEICYFLNKRLWFTVTQNKPIRENVTEVFTQTHHEDYGFCENTYLETHTNIQI